MHEFYAQRQRGNQSGAAGRDGAWAPHLRRGRAGPQAMGCSVRALHLLRLLPTLPSHPHQRQERGGVRDVERVGAVSHADPRTIDAGASVRDLAGMAR